MRNSPEYIKILEKKAKEWNVTLDAMIRIDAIYNRNQELKNKK